MTTPQASFAQAYTRRAFDDIIDQVREQLRAGTLKPGHRLPSERDFAQQLGVSRNTVREAVRMLEIAGLVTLKKGATGGAFITSNNSDALSQGFLDGLTLGSFSVSDLMAARITLDTEIARLAALEASPEDVEELRNLVSEAKSFAEPDQWPKRLESHLAFEKRLAEVAGNPILTLLLHPLLELTSKISLRIGPSIGNEVWEEREELLDALINHDSDRAEATVREYLEFLHDSWVGTGAE